MLYVVYVLYGTGLQAAQEQRELHDDLTRTWASPAPVSAVLQAAATPHRLGTAATCTIAR